MKFTANDVFLNVNKSSVDSFLKYASQAAFDAGYTEDTAERVRKGAGIDRLYYNAGNCG